MPSSPRTSALYHGALPPAAATGALAACVATFYAVAASLPAGLGRLAAAQLALGLCAIVAVRVLGQGPVGQTLALRRPRPSAMVGALLIGATAWLPNLALAVWVSSWWSGPTSVPALDRLLADSPAIWSVTVLAVFPAMCEELAFRGVWARSLAARAGVPLTCVITGLGFGLFHLSPAQLVPTSVLGALLAWASLRSGSLWTAMVLHATNNAVAGAVAAGLVGPIARWTMLYPRSSIMLAVSVALVGCFVLRKGEPSK